MPRKPSNSSAGIRPSPVRDAPEETRVMGRLGKHIRKLRLKRKLTQTAAAKIALIDQNHWQAIEHARTNPTVATLVGIARALGVKPHELFTEEDEDEGDDTSSPPSQITAGRPSR